MLLKWWNARGVVEIGTTRPITSGPRKDTSARRTGRPAHARLTHANWRASFGV